MQAEAPFRLSLTENEDAHGVVATIASRLSISSPEAASLLDAASVRLRRELRLRSAPMERQGDSLRVDGVAGLIKISSQLELEVAPKFLGSFWPEWRSDFFVLAVLSRYGTLLPFERLMAGFGARGDLAALVGRAMIEEYRQNQRRPLRTYRRETVRDFSLDGDVAADELLLRDPDGYEQARLVLARSNPYNAVLHAATHRLLPEIGNPEIRLQLSRMRGELAPQLPPPRQRPARVPGRHRGWRPLYELGRQVLDGFGVDLAGAIYAVSPGYVMRTAKAWEDLVTLALRLGLTGTQVQAQRGFHLGFRNGRAFDTTPDVVVTTSDSLMLVDAKYKTRTSVSEPRIDTADIYEGLAFMRASGAKKLALLYPQPMGDVAAPPAQLGGSTLFESITVGDENIQGFLIEVRGISQREGLHHFANHLGTTMASLL